MILSAIVSLAANIYSTVTAINTAKFNQKMALRQAHYAEQKSIFEAKQRETQTRRLLSEQRVGYASSGVSLLSGSAQDVMGDTIEQGAIDAMIIRYSGKAEANKYHAQAGQFRNEANAAAIKGLLQAASSASSNASSMIGSQGGSTLLSNY